MRDPTAWRQQAACRGIDPAVFYPDLEEPAHGAKAICIGCPVRQACLEWALATREKEGVWGGCDERDRRRILRQTRRSA